MTSAMACYMVLDQGGQSSRALIFDRKGKLLSNISSPVATRAPRPGWVEQDPVQVLNSVKQAAFDAFDCLPVSYQSNLKAVGLVCQRSSIVNWCRESGQALSPVISWQDRRAADMLDEILEKDPSLAKQIPEKTGLFPNPHFGASKIYWCLKKLPELEPALREGKLVCAPLVSYLLYQLADEGPLFVDGGNASRTMLWNLHTCDWDAELLRCFDIPSNILPISVNTLYDFGQFQIGKCFYPIRYLNGDQNAAFFSLGHIDSTALYMNIGTGAFCSALWNGESESVDRLLKTIVVALSAPIYMLEGTVNGAAAALEWAFEYLDLPSNFKDLGDSLARVDAPPLFLNGVGGLGSPYWQANFDSKFVGEGSDEEKLVAVLESILFLLHVNLDYMKHAGICINKVNLSGGLSLMDGLCQRLTDLLEIPVFRPEIVEASARGAAFWLAGCPASWSQTKGDWFKPQQSTIGKRYRCWKLEMDSLLA